MDFRKTETCFPGGLGRACLRAVAAAGMNKGALRHIAIAVWKLRLR